MKIDNVTTALVVTDPQNDFLSENGAAWGLVGESVRENDTIANLEALMTAARDGGYKTFVSPHYYYPSDKQWQFGGALEKKMHEIDMFKRSGPLDLSGFDGSGADWLARLEPLLTASNAIVVSPHKVYGPQNNDLALQLRKHGISKVILAGMSANLCVESHMRDLVEQGFEVFVVKDATAAARDPKLGDGYQAAVVNFNFIASKVLDTRDAVDAMR